jgi:hypothetical protein
LWATPTRNALHCFFKAHTEWLPRNAVRPECTKCRGGKTKVGKVRQCHKMSHSHRNSAVLIKLNRAFLHSKADNPRDPAQQKVGVLCSGNPMKLSTDRKTIGVDWCHKMSPTQCAPKMTKESLSQPGTTSSREMRPGKSIWSSSGTTREGQVDTRGDTRSVVCFYS